MLVTFPISLSLSPLGGSLFRTIYLKNPEFDPHGELYHVSFTAVFALAAVRPFGVHRVHGCPGVPTRGHPRHPWEKIRPDGDGTVWN